MDNNPFDQFLKSTGIDMLTAALPYIGPHGRKPLALYMKLQEIERIYHDMDDDDVLSACGFENQTADPEAMLRAMKLASGGKPTPQIDQILNLLTTLKTYRSVTEMMQKNPELAAVLSNFTNQTSQQINPKDLLRHALPKEPDTNQMMSFLAELIKSSDFPH